jgi:hypothetical protein
VLLLLPKREEKRKVMSPRTDQNQCPVTPKACKTNRYNARRCGDLNNLAQWEIPHAPGCSYQRCITYLFTNFAIVTNMSISLIVVKLTQRSGRLHDLFRMRSWYENRLDFLKVCVFGGVHSVKSNILNKTFSALLQRFFQFRFLFI